MMDPTPSKLFDFHRRPEMRIDLLFLFIVVCICLYVLSLWVGFNVNIQCGILSHLAGWRWIILKFLLQSAGKKNLIYTLLLAP